MSPVGRSVARQLEMRPGLDSKFSDMLLAALAKMDNKASSTS